MQRPEQRDDIVDETPKIEVDGGHLEAAGFDLREIQHIVDDVQQAVTSHVADRRKEAERAEAIVALEAQRFQARLPSLDVVPTIVSLQDHLETIRQAEIDRVRGRLGSLSPDQELAVDALTRGIINKIMHTPISTLKTAARESEATTVIDLVRRLFNLQEKKEVAVSSKSGSAGSPGAKN